jgi:hypothetical protein
MTPEMERRAQERWASGVRLFDSKTCKLTEAGRAVVAAAHPVARRREAVRRPEPVARVARPLSRTRKAAAVDTTSLHAQIWARIKAKPGLTMGDHATAFGIPVGKWLAIRDGVNK